MSTKRASTHEQTNDGSDSTFQKDDNAKRAKLTSPSDTTLQNLPVEIVEYILVKAVAMEVIGMGLVKRVWDEKIDVVIDRLRTVSSLWNSIVTTDIFRDQVSRILNGTVEKLVRMEILYQSPLKFCVSGLTTLRDELFLLVKAKSQGYLINVYDRNNMDVVKDVVLLPGLRPHSITACNVSNCVYILNRKTRNHFSILRIAITNDHWSIVSPLTDEIRLPQPILCVTASGSLVLTRQQTTNFAAVNVCDTNGSTQHEVRLPPDDSRIWSIIPKSNGNLVVVLNHTDSCFMGDMAEIDMNGILIRREQSVHCACNSVISLADSYGRIWAGDNFAGMWLLDSEFNHMDFVGHFIAPQVMHYNSARDETVAIAPEEGSQNGVLNLIIFQLREIRKKALEPIKDADERNYYGF